MPKCIIDGIEAEFTPGENLIEVSKRVHVDIPLFCYHPALSVVAQCRMCAVEIEKMPKLQTACSTAAVEGMVVHTQSLKTKANQKSVMEFLLLNHPLDCPICDKSGECDLQDNSYDYGDAYSRNTEERRTYLDLDMGPVIKKNMNRCIHCTRCIRFGDEIAGIREMVAVQRGNNTEITTIDGKPLQTEYAGNYADVCPTGSLTIKDFRFQKRVWFLQKTATVCEGCSRGCNMEIHEEKNTIYRCVPRENKEINKHWMCDEGRFNFEYVHSSGRVIQPAVKGDKGLELKDWKSTILSVREAAKGKSAAFLIGSDMTNEEIILIQGFAKQHYPNAELVHYGTAGITSTSDDADADKILKRKSKTSNLHGAEKCGLKGFSGTLKQKTDLVFLFRGGRAQLPDTKSFGTAKVIGVGVFEKAQADTFMCVLPATSFAEKDGTIVNSQGIEQHFKRAINPVGQSKQISEVFMYWNNLK